MTVSIRLENVNTEETRQLGEFDFVQLTYDTLRVGPDGEEIAWLNGEDDWYLMADETLWTDIIIAPTGS